MSAPEAPRRPLPDKPSIEFLRKEAKRLAKAESVRLTDAQRRPAPAVVLSAANAIQLNASS